MIVLTILLGIGAIHVSNNLIDLNRKLFAHPFTVSNTVRDIKGDIVEIHRDMKDVAWILEPHEIDRAAGEINKKEAHAFERFDIVMDRFLGNKAKVEGARRSFSEWREIRAEVIKLARSGQRREAAEITAGRGARHVSAMLGKLDGLIAFAHGKAAEFLAESDAKNKQYMLILLALIVVVVVSSGGIAAFVIVTIGRAERDLEQRDRQIRHAKKMEAVGQLTGGLAHDLNNVLGIISANVELLTYLRPNDPELSKYADAAMKGIVRASDLTRKLLNFSRTNAGETKRIAANDFIKGMESLIAKSLTPAIAMEMDLTVDPWMVDVDPADLEAALLNLALNSRDAMPNGGSLVIETANKVIDQNYVKHNPTSSAGEFVMISVSDTGTGMTAEQAEKAFEPFFTTKEVGKGTGLGLSMVYAFVERSGGHAKIYSEPSEGTTVRLYLPRARGRTDEIDPPVSDPSVLPRGTETILVVDDEKQLVEAAAKILGSLGYRTMTAANGQEALAILRRDRSVDLLFSDVIMPGALDGYRLAIQALKERPDLRVLLTSGFSRKREEFVNGERRIASELAKALLDKPYNIAELARAVRCALDQGTIGAG